MKRRFAEITITPSSFSKEEFKNMLNTASFLGFKVVGFNIHVKNFKNIPEVKNYAEKLGLELVSRVDVTFSDIGLIKKYLKKYRKKVELISIKGFSRKIISFGCRDRRIDIIRVDPHYKFTLFKGDVKQILEQDKAIEITAKPLIYAKNFQERVRTLQSYEKTLKTILKKRIKFVFGSGACSPAEMRDARSLASLLVSFFDMDYAKALDSLSCNVMSIVERNRLKLSPNFIWPGVYLLEEEKYEGKI